MVAKFYIYRNLRTGGFSVRQDGKVIDRPSEFIAERCMFKVSEPGRQRVLQEQQKNVHAFVVAEYYESRNWEVDEINKVSYNPYTAPTFMFRGRPIEDAYLVAFQKGKCYVIEE